MREEILHRGDQRDCLRLLLVSRVVSISLSLDLDLDLDLSLSFILWGHKQRTTNNRVRKCAARCER